MQKKTFIFLFIICILHSIHAQEYYWVNDGMLFRLTDSKNASVIDYYSISVDPIEIPSFIVFENNSYRVTSIAKDAGISGSSLTIPNTITYIGKHGIHAIGWYDSTSFITVAKDNPVFDSRDNCNAIIHTSSNTLIVACKNTHIPKSVTAIGDYAFRMLELPSINIPKSITSIGKGAFMTCSGFTVAKANPVYDSRNNCNAIIHTKSNTLIAGCKDTRIPESVTTIGKHSFQYVKGLDSITIPKSVTRIEDFAFSYCENLSSIVLPDSLISIGEAAFINCNISSITLPHSLTIIGKHAFGGCRDLESISFPNSLIIIDDEAFRGCDGLKSVVIPKSVTSFGKNVFAYCYLDGISVENTNPIYDSRDNCNAIIRTSSNTLIMGIQNTRIPESVTTIDDSAFMDCGLDSIVIPNSVTFIGEEAFGYNHLLYNITIPQSVIHIGRKAFFGCGLCSILIPNSVTFVGEGAFNSCGNLTTITVEEANPVYDSRDNCNAIIHTASNSLIAGCKNTQIPYSATSIGALAFAYCDDLTDVELPNSLISIGDAAFFGCDDLTEIEIPNSVTHIGTRAFSSCRELYHVSIPNSVVFIGDNAFDESGYSSLEVEIAPDNPVYEVRNCGDFNCIVEKNTGKVVSKIQVVDVYGE